MGTIPMRINLTFASYKSIKQRSTAGRETFVKPSDLTECQTLQAGWYVNSHRFKVNNIMFELGW
jgi:hypothetical protein